MKKAENHVFRLNGISVARFVVNNLWENTYVVFNDCGMGIVIDCGARSETERQYISAFFDNHNITPSAHIVTHAHFDHLWGAQWLFETYGLEPTIPQREQPNYNNAEKTACQTFHRQISLPLPTSPILNDEISFFSFHTIHTPGHTSGSVCFYSEQHNTLFSGDTLFKDFPSLPKEPGMTIETIQKSIKEKLHTLPKGTQVFPGHGVEFYL